MSTEQAYVNGFVKRATQYGYSQHEAMNILKAAAELKGGQHKLDVNKNGKIEAADLKKLRQFKQAADVPYTPQTLPGTPDTNILTNLFGSSKPATASTGSLSTGSLSGVDAAPKAVTGGSLRSGGLNAVAPARVNQPGAVAPAAAGGYKPNMNERINNVLPKFLQNPNAQGPVHPADAYKNIR
jgi:hypothetical protein